MNHLVIGCGQVGRALMEVLKCKGYDPQKGLDDVSLAHPVEPFEFLHICIPYSEGDRPPDVSTNVAWLNFHQWVRAYQQHWTPAFTVIHSTVPIGTSDSLGAHHSPIRGKHPHLAESIRTFVKYVGGPHAGLIAEEFEKHGIKAHALQSARDTEAGKLIDLMQFGASVLIEKEIHRFCGEHGLNFDLVYREFNSTYNSGYSAMGDDHFTRPILDHHEGPIGGHCVVQNMRWLDMETARLLREEQKALQVASATEVSA